MSLFGYELGVDPWQLAMIAGSVGFGGIVKGITGIGLPLVALSILVIFFDPIFSIGVVVLPITVTNFWQAFRSGMQWSLFRRFGAMIICFLVAMLASARLVVELDTRTLFGVLGICVLVFSGSSLFKPRARPLATTTERWAGPLAGALGGILGGMITIWGPPMMMYFVLLKLEKDIWVRVVGLVWALGSVPLVLGYWQNGVLGPATAPVSAIACIPGMAGVLAGEIIRRHINQQVFAKVVLVALFIIGLNLVRRAVF